MKCSLSNLLFGALYGLRTLGGIVVCVLAGLGAIFGALLAVLVVTGNASDIHMDRVTCAFGIPMGVSLLGLVTYGLCRNWRKTVQAWAEVFAVLGAFFGAVMYVRWVSKTVPGNTLFSVFHVAGMPAVRRIELVPAQLAVVLLCLFWAGMLVAIGVVALQSMCEFGAKQRIANKAKRLSQEATAAA